MKKHNYLALFIALFLLQEIFAVSLIAQKKQAQQIEPEFELIIDRTRKQELLPAKFDNTSLFFNLLKKQTMKLNKVKSNDLATQQIANILWAADGYKYLNPNNPPPKSFVDIFLVMEDGVYRWQANEKKLEDISIEDHRKLTWKMKDFEGSTLSLVYVIDIKAFTEINGNNDYKNSLDLGMKIGAISANVKLAASYEKLWAFDPIALANNKLKSVFRLSKDQEIIAVQCIATMQ